MNSHKKKPKFFKGIPFGQQPDVPVLNLVNCCCLLGAKCKEAQKLCSTFLFSQHLCGYVTIPSDPVIKEKWLECFEESTRNQVSLLSRNNQVFALHHFDPTFVANCRNESTTENRFRLPKTVDEREGILYNFPILGNKKYYPIPNFTDVNFAHYIIRVECLFVQRMESETSHLPYHNMTEVITNINADRHFYLLPTKTMIRSCLSEEETQLLSQFKNYPEISAMKYVHLECEKIKLDEKLSINQKNEFVGYAIGFGKDGLTRINLVSDIWHDQHPHAAHFFFGFKNWNETKLYICSLFDETDDMNPSIIADLININSYNIPISSFEKVLITLMRFTRGIQIEFLSYIWLKSITRIAEYIQTWSPRVGEAGEDLSILDINESFLTDETPLGYIEQNLKNVAVQVDGKDFMADVPRYNSFFKRAMYSDKVNHSAFRVITWTTKMGLSVEHTSLFCGRCTESRHVELHGSYVGNCLNENLSRLPRVGDSIFQFDEEENEQLSSSIIFI